MLLCGAEKVRRSLLSLPKHQQRILVEGANIRQPFGPQLRHSVVSDVSEKQTIRNQIALVD
jgi:hypothetical protein